MEHITESYFYNEIIEFRKHFGSKDWWQLPEEKRELCIKALGYSYFNIKKDDGSDPSEEDKQQYATVLDTTLMEYERRKTFMLLYRLKQLL